MERHQAIDQLIKIIEGATDWKLSVENGFQTYRGTYKNQPITIQNNKDYLYIFYINGSRVDFDMKETQKINEYLNIIRLNTDKKNQILFETNLIQQMENYKV